VALLVTFLTPPVQDETLRDFYQRVRPGRWGWRRIAAKYGIPRSPYLAKAVVNLLLGLALLFLVNFGVGTLLLRSRWLGIAELLAGALLALVLIKRIREEEQLPDPQDSAPPSPGQGIV